ncbi:O-antigen ligase [Cytobacillus eiseniae]|uniref:O-antigen ligase n=1 Tax=Cytobacillus eiseniae TaxID=762947 RepID=A0ABS4RH04_9BACI|nr:O-antigen ligase [Cytobacillus eiseniae]
MKQKINIGSFISSIVCILLFVIVSFSDLINNSVLGVHPLNLVFSFTLITFLLGVVGLSGVQNWKGMARSITTIIVTVGLSVFLSFILFFGTIFS